ncbi:hypothetical protein EV199_1733 [Pseudobacter ginsenosidimutans]|uniref:Uncharacterized protein n=1 Tax=Pseudobacter ginsenosidimutans TaxID=661488 RepID=A0A4Q7N4D9_9BACT|nr:hypothetical protein EV199_1733 [Pseudobacter ginsenosidimutans]
MDRLNSRSIFCLSNKVQLKFFSIIITEMKRIFGCNTAGNDYLNKHHPDPIRALTFQYKSASSPDQVHLIFTYSCYLSY